MNNAEFNSYKTCKVLEKDFCTEEYKRIEAISSEESVRIRSQVNFIGQLHTRV